MGPLVSDNYVYVDHRTVVGVREVGRDDHRRTMQILAEQGGDRVVYTTLATRGERHALLRLGVQSYRDADDSFASVLLGVVTRSPDDRFASITVYGLEDEDRGASRAGTTVRASPAATVESLNRSPQSRWDPPPLSPMPPAGITPPLSARTELISRPSTPRSPWRIAETRERGSRHPGKGRNVGVRGQAFMTQRDSFAARRVGLVDSMPDRRPPSQALSREIPLLAVDDADHTSTMAITDPSEVVRRRAHGLAKGSGRVDGETDESWGSTSPDGGTASNQLVLFAQAMRDCLNEKDHT
jgi:hypothetical protein